MRNQGHCCGRVEMPMAFPTEEQRRYEYWSSSLNEGPTGTNILSIPQNFVHYNLLVVWELAFQRYAMTNCRVSPARCASGNLLSILAITPVQLVVIKASSFGSVRQRQAQKGLLPKTITTHHLIALEARWRILQAPPPRAY